MATLPTVPLDQWRPGRSVAHARGMAGSLGAFVVPTDITHQQLELPPDVPVQAFISAAHVLAAPHLNPKKDDWVSSPGSPDEKRLARFRCATLKDFNELGTPNYINDLDIALAVMTGHRQVSNHVPDPNDPEQLVRLRGHHSEAQLTQLVGQGKSVYLIGRTTGFAKGRLTQRPAGAVDLEVNVNMVFLYKDLWAVAWNAPQLPFSQPGDSGALIYSCNHLAVGFVVGAKGSTTFFYSAEACLTKLGVELV